MRRDILVPEPHDQQAAEFYDLAIATYARLVHEEGHRELQPDLAWCYMNRATYAKAWSPLRGLTSRSLELFGPPRGMNYYRLGDRDLRASGARGRTPRLADHLARCYMNKASALDDNRQAVELYDQAITTYERLVYQEGHRELAGDLAWRSSFGPIPSKRSPGATRSAGRKER